MGHLDDTTIELYVLNADQVKKQWRQIESHLAKCEGCREIHTRVASFYADVKEDMAAAENLPVLRREGLPERIEHFLKRRYYDRGPLRPIDVALPVRIARWILHHPYISASGGLTAAALVVALALLTLKLEIKDRNPAYGRAKDEFLIVYNKEGQELWKKHIDRNYDLDLQKSYSFLQSNPDRALTTVDVDGDGENEILSIFGWVLDSLQLRNVILCFNADGSERWKYVLHRSPTIGGVKYSDDWEFYLMCVGDFDRDGNLDIIAAGIHLPWFPNVLVRLNARDGSFVSEYWHNGMLHEFEHRDLDGDGVEELIFGGQNNRFQGACVAVLDPRHIEGTAPAPDEFRPQGVQTGLEKYYLLIPASDLKPFWSDITNEVFALTMKANNMLEVVVWEKLGQLETPTYYVYFDSTMRCVNARASDNFAAVHARFESEGKVIKKLDTQYWDEFIRGVRYWDGERFVSEPTMNKRYLEVMKHHPIP